MDLFETIAKLNEKLLSIHEHLEANGYSLPNESSDSRGQWKKKWVELVRSKCKELHIFDNTKTVSLEVFSDCHLHHFDADIVIKLRIADDHTSTDGASSSEGRIIEKIVNVEIDPRRGYFDTEKVMLTTTMLFSMLFFNPTYFYCFFYHIKSPNCFLFL